jgi:acid phosphatase
MVLRIAALLALISTTAWPSVAFADEGGGSRLDSIKHIVVIYEENHSFDNLYGTWEGVNGLANAGAHTIQLAQDGITPYNCLLQNDVNLVANPGACVLPNAPFRIETYIPATAMTCPQPGFFYLNGVLPSSGNRPGGCTKDIVHRFYQEQYQLNRGAQNLYVTGSDAAGLAMGNYNTQNLPIYAYLHSPGHPQYAISDNFFQAAFGGSFLNHQWLIAAATPTYATAPANLYSIIDSNGMPTSYPPLYHATGTVKDAPLTQACPTVVSDRACGAYAVNTIQPTFQPTSSNPVKLPPQTGMTIGDELSNAHVSWAWYSGGWSNANGSVGAPGWTNGTAPGPASAPCPDPQSSPNPSWPHCPHKVFQFHHQPFNYYAAFDPSTPSGLANRTKHLADEQAFIQLANASSKVCKLNSVSFVKPIGLENEHPGYTSESTGSNHLVDLLQAIQNSACRKNTMVVVTYDEFGGQWDHVSPPGQGGTPGPHDLWGPGTRIPALVIAPHLEGNFVVDHTQYDTTSILATIEHRFDLAPLSSRDATVNDLSRVFRAEAPDQQEGGGQT